MLRRTTGMLFMLLLLLLALPLSAAAGSTTQFRGKSVNAEFATIDASGCVYTNASVFASATRFNSTKPKSGDEYSSVSVYLSRFDVCTDTTLLAAFGNAFVDGTELLVSDKLKTAALTTTVEMYDDVSGNLFTVDLDLDWTATTACVQQKSRYSITSPGYKITYRFNGTSCDAVATGEVTSGTTNYAAEGSDYAQIMSARSGSIFVER